MTDQTADTDAKTDADSGVAEPATLVATDQAMVPKAQLDQEIGKRQQLEGDLTALADALLAEVPEHLKPLIPDGLAPAAKIRWFQNARATDVFGTQAANVPATDQDKPKTTPQDRDLSTLPVHARIAAGYGRKVR